MEIAIINQDKIILLILKIFTKIVTIIEIIMKIYYLIKHVRSST